MNEDELIKYQVEQILESRKEKYKEVTLNDLNEEFIGNDVYIKADINSLSGFKLINFKEVGECMACGFNGGDITKKCSSCGAKVWKKLNPITEGYYFASAVQMIQVDNNTKVYDLIVNLGSAQNKLYSRLNQNKEYYLFGTLRARQQPRKEPYLYLELHFAHELDASLEAISINEDQIKSFQSELLKDDFQTNLKNSIYGSNDLIDSKYINDMLLLQLLGSQKEYSSSNVLQQRGNIHILFAGSPGTGKSYLLKTQQNILPRSKYASSTGATAIGLTASMQKDSITGKWSVGYGVMPMCHKGGVACIDEFDKIKTDQDKINTILESLKFTVNKAGISVSIDTDISVLVAMNPKGKSFDINELPYDQLNLDDDVRDRFDLIVNLDYFKKKKVDSIFGSLERKVDIKQKVYAYDMDFILSFIAYAKKFNPDFDYDSLDYFKKRYLSFLDGKVSGSYRSARLLNSTVRICRAYSRLRLSNNISSYDIDKAFNLIIVAYKSMGLIKMMGGVEMIDIKRAENIRKQSTHEKRSIIRKVILSMDSGHGVSDSMVNESCNFEGCLTLLDKMYEQGELMMPKANHYKVVN